MNKKAIPLSTQCACLDNEGNAWIFSDDFNGLFFLDTDNYELCYVTSFNEENFTETLYNEARWHNNKVYLFPCIARDVAVYDTKTDKKHYIALEKRKKAEYYNVTEISETKVLLLPVELEDHAYILDLESENYQIISLECEDVKQEVKHKILRGKACINGKAYYAIDGTNHLLAYSIEDNMFYVEVSKNSDPFFMTFSAKEIMYILEANGAMYAVYNQKGYQETIKLIEKLNSENTWGPEMMRYMSLWPLESNLLIGMPMRGYPLYILDNKKTFEFDIEWKRVSIYKSNLQPLYICGRKKKKLFLFPYHSYTLVVVDLESTHTDYIDLEVSGDDFIGIYSEKLKKRLNEKGPLSESAYCTLDTYLNLIVETEIHTNRTPEITVGKQIYQSLIV